MGWTRLCRLADLKEGVGRFVEAGGLQLAVFLYQGTPHVVDDYCPHAGASLSGGHLEDGHIICPWHFWAFNLQTGKLAPTGHAGIQVYPCRKSADGLFVEAQLPLALPAQAAQMIDLDPPQT